MVSLHRHGYYPTSNDQCQTHGTHYQPTFTSGYTSTLDQRFFIFGPELTRPWYKLIFSFHTHLVTHDTYLASHSCRQGSWARRGLRDQAEKIRKGTIDETGGAHRQQL